jgi:hypothetical protein
MTGADAWIIGMVLACVLGALVIGRGSRAERPPALDSAAIGRTGCVAQEIP